MGLGAWQVECPAERRATRLRFFVRLMMKRTAKELAESLAATLEGDGSLEVAGVASPERAGARDLIYVERAKHAARAAASAALCAIAGEGVALPGKTVLRTPHPKVAFAKAAELLLGRPPIATGIHATAIVAPLARISPGVSIGPCVVIGEDAHVGAGTQIGAHSVTGAVIGADGFGYAPGEGKYWKFPQAGIVEIGDDVEIGANTTIDRGSLDDTRIAEGVKLDNLVHIGHNCQVGAHTVIAAQAGLSGSCTFGKHIVVGGQAGFGERCKLEDNSVIGGQSGVLGGKTIRTGETVWGTPARPLERFKELYAWYGQLPALAARIKELEAKIGGK